MKKVITVGVFDYFHLGHLRLFQQAKNLGDYLIVAVQDNDWIKKTKPDANIMYSTQQRIELVSALRIVDEVIVYTDVDVTLPTVDFDIFAVGEDQNHNGFKRAIEWCNNSGKQIVRLYRTPNICSSSITSTLN